MERGGGAGGGIVERGGGAGGGIMERGVEQGRDSEGRRERER